MPVCEMCHTPDGDPEVIYLHGRCHMNTPSWVSIEGRDLIIRCYLPDCKREIGRFRIVDGDGVEEIVNA